MRSRFLYVATEQQIDSVRSLLSINAISSIALVSDLNGAIFLASERDFQAIVLCSSLPLAVHDELARKLALVAPQTEIISMRSAGLAPRAECASALLMALSNKELAQTGSRRQ